MDEMNYVTNLFPIHNPSPSFFRFFDLLYFEGRILLYLYLTSLPHVFVCFESAVIFTCLTSRALYEWRRRTRRSTMSSSRSRRRFYSSTSSFSSRLVHGAFQSGHLYKGLLPSFQPRPLKSFAFSGFHTCSTLDYELTVFF